MPKPAKLSGLLIAISVVAALAGLLFGFDVGVISGAQIFIKETFALTAAEQGILVGGVPFGALLASAVCGKFNDLLGRRNNLLFTAALFAIGSLGCSLAQSIDVLIIFRLLVGLAIGVGSFSAPLYIAEVSEEAHRGGLVTLNQLAIVTGILLAYLIDYYFAPTHNWRAMFLFGLIPAALLFVLAWFLPESPRWLMVRNKLLAAKKVLRRIHGADKAEHEFGELQKVIDEEQSRTTTCSVGMFSKVLWLGILVSILTQAVGINAIIYYAPLIFKQTGFGHTTTAILATVGVGVVNVVFTLIAIRLLDKFGRRPLLLTGVAGIALSLVLLVVSFSVNIQLHPMFAWLSFLAVIMFVACQAFSTGPMCWLIPSEIFPTNARGLGMGLSVAFNWGTNVLVAFFFPIVSLHFGGVASFAMFLVIAIIAWIYFYTKVPETKGVSLEHIEENLFNGKKTRYLGR